MLRGSRRRRWKRLRQTHKVCSHFTSFSLISVYRRVLIYVSYFLASSSFFSAWAGLCYPFRPARSKSDAISGGVGDRKLQNIIKLPSVPCGNKCNYLPHLIPKNECSSFFLNNGQKSASDSAMYVLYSGDHWKRLYLFPRCKRDAEKGEDEPNIKTKRILPPGIPHESNYVT